MRIQTAKSILAISLITVLVCTVAAFAQQSETARYPNRPINFIVPFSAGGSTDLAVRVLAKEAEKSLGQPIVVVNKPGGGGSVGFAAIANAKPDGYTIGQSPGGATLFIMPFLEKMPYNVVKDVRYVMQFIELDFGILVKGDSPYKTFKDLLDFGRANPGKLVYGTNAPNSISNLIIEQIARKEKVQTKHIPFKSSPEFQTGLLGGHIVFAVGDFNYSLVDSGELRLVAMLSEKRAPAFPKIPTLKELGYDMPCPVFIGVVAPRGTPEEIVRKIEAAFAKGMQEPAFLNGMKDLRYTPRYRDSKEFTEYVTGNYELFGRLLKELGLAKE